MKTAREVFINLNYKLLLYALQRGNKILIFLNKLNK